MERLEQILSEIAGRENVRENEPMKNHTTFRAGGAARLFVTPEDEDALVRLEKTCQSAGVSYTVVGNGSNLLVSDSGYDGVIIQLGSRFAHCRRDGDVLEAEAGILLSKLARFACDQGLSGLEFAYGIPGCVGGAVYMNAGAYGGEIKDVLACATFLDETGAERTLQAGELQLGYRTSVFEREPWCILSATFTLREDDTGPIRERMADYARRRMEKQPLDMPSAGSTFKRPEGAYAGALIDQCGLRGYAIGGAQVSQKHCGFIVNTGNATCADVLCLADTVCKIVTDETGFQLEKEVRVVK